MTSEEKTRLFRAIFDENHLPLLAYALRRTPDACDAAEVLADTMLVAWRPIGEVPAGATGLRSSPSRPPQPPLSPWGS